MSFLEATQGWTGGRLDLPVLYFFTLAGFFLVPGGLDRWVWLMPASFLGLNLFFFLAPASLQPHVNPWVYIAFSQVPWVLFCLDFLMRGRASHIVERASLRSWIAWPLFRLMGVGYVFTLYTGGLPAEFAFKMAFGDVVTALGAALLWLAYRPQSTAYVGLIFFWNTYGLITALACDWRLLTANPHVSLGTPSLGIHGYFAEFPRTWIPFFWVPAAIAAHGVIFYKLYLELNSGPITASPDTFEKAGSS